MSPWVAAALALSVVDNLVCAWLVWRMMETKRLLIRSVELQLAESFLRLTPAQRAQTIKKLEDEGIL